MAAPQTTPEKEAEEQAKDLAYVCHLIRMFLKADAFGARVGWTLENYSDVFLAMRLKQRVKVVALARASLTAEKP